MNTPKDLFRQPDTLDAVIAVVGMLRNDLLNFDQKAAASVSVHKREECGDNSRIH